MEKLSKLLSKLIIGGVVLAVGILCFVANGQSSKDGTLEGINVSQTKDLIDATGLDIVASGGAKSEADVKNAKDIHASGIILGKSIYSGEINLEEIIKKYED